MLGVTALVLAGAAMAPVSVVLQAVQSPVSADDPTCGSATLLKADGEPWTCTFDEEFSGDSLDTGTWTVQRTETTGYHNGGDCFVGGDRAVEVSGGLLSLTSSRTTTPFTCRSPDGDFTAEYTSGMVSTYGTFAQAFGRWEIRARFPKADVPGLHSALWLWPQDDTRYGGWSASGEIDIAERYTQYPDRAIPFLHYLSRTQDVSVTNNYCLIDDPSQFHTYTVVWTTSRITIDYDGDVCVDHRIDPAEPLEAPAPFDRPFFIALTQTLGQQGNSVTSETPFPGTTQVDYVRAWS